MPEPRILLEGACYHVVTRGNRKQTVFHDPTDFEYYCRLLSRYKKRYHTKCYAYCLMPNHVHLLLRPNGTSKLPKFMQGLSLSYALWFNKKYNKVGHLWQNRYKSLVIHSDRYLLDCIQYIEFNPLKDRLAKEISDYKWTSYHARVLGGSDPLLDPLDLLS